MAGVRIFGCVLLSPPQRWCFDFTVGLRFEVFWGSSFLGWGPLGACQQAPYIFFAMAHTVWVVKGSPQAFAPLPESLDYVPSQLCGSAALWFLGKGYTYSGGTLGFFYVLPPRQRLFFAFLRPS